MGKPRVKRPPQGKDYAALGMEYARSVVAGIIPTSKVTIQACERQLRDMEGAESGTFGWSWEPERGDKVCKFIENLPHIKGRWKSKTLVLEPWQCFVICCLFGWVDAEGFRRFTTGYIEVPRKNAKTTIGAGIAEYMFCEDGEPGAEIYSAAVTKDQAKISWEVAKEQMRRDPEMLAHYGIEISAHAIAIPATASIFVPLARDADSLEGKSPHFALIDELHAHKTREVWDVLNIGRGSRRQSMILAITTAGDDKTGIGYEQHAYLRSILADHVQDERYFGIIYTIDAEDDWTSEEAHRKANPNYGVSVMIDDIETMCRQAKANANAQNNFLTKRTNVWMSVGTAYFNMLAWDRLCKKPELRLEDFHGCDCLMHLDLASKRDIAEKLKLFYENGIFYVFGTHYLPGDVIETGNPNYEAYREWASKDRLILTDGNRTDYSRIEADVMEDMRLFKVRRIGVDPLYNAEHLTQRLQSFGCPMIDVAHTVTNFSEPMKTLDALIVAGKVRHDGDPVLSWAMANVHGKQDAKDNVYPRKVRDSDKIDPAVALIAAMSIHLREQIQPDWDFKVVAI